MHCFPRACQINLHEIQSIICYLLSSFIAVLSFFQFLHPVKQWICCFWLTNNLGMVLVLKSLHASCTHCQTSETKRTGWHLATIVTFALEVQIEFGNLKREHHKVRSKASLDQIVLSSSLGHSCSLLERTRSWV